MTVTHIEALLVEDNRILARLITDALQEDAGSDIVVTRVERLAAAREILKQRSFDVMLLDLSLPDSRGTETVVRARAMAADLPIVVMSACNDDFVTREALSHGAQAYLVKGDAGVAEMVRTVSQVIEDRRCAKDATS